jgi:hypothetical protein
MAFLFRVLVSVTVRMRAVSSQARSKTLTPARHHPSPFFTQFSDNRHYFQLLFAVNGDSLRSPALSCVNGMVPVPAA